MNGFAVKSDIYAPSVCEDLRETIVSNAAFAKMFDLRAPFKLYERLMNGEKLTTQEYTIAWIIEQIIDLWFEQNPDFKHEIGAFEYCFEEVEA